MTSKEEKMYAQLGFLSTQFANIEQKIHDILVRIVTKDRIDYWMLDYMMESESLEKKLQYLEKAIWFDWIHKDSIKKLVKLIRVHKGVRNSFIHGTWHPFTKDGKEKIAVFNLKIDKINKANPENPAWARGVENTYSIEDIIEINKEIGKITTVADDVLAAMDSKGFEP